MPQRNANRNAKVKGEGGYHTNNEVKVLPQQLSVLY